MNFVWGRPPVRLWRKWLNGRLVKNTMATWLLVMGVLLTFIAMSCKENETGPDTKPIKEYIWTIDTLTYPGSFQTAMSDMWASSSTNVYIVGHNARILGTMYHYDGHSWTPVKFSQAEGGTIRVPHDLNAIDGTAPDDIWCVGYRYFRDTISTRIIDSSLIIHFNGNRWDEYIVHGGRQLLNVWAGSRTNVWATGAEGTVFHYDGTLWTKYDLGRDYYFANVAGVITSPTSFKVYTIGYRDDYTSPNDSSGYFLFEYDGSQWKVLDSVSLTHSSPTPHFGYGLWSDGQQVYSLSSNGIFTLNGQQWNKIFTGSVGHMYKSGYNNIFAVGERVYRYDGLLWKEYSQFFSEGTIGWYDCYTDSNQVFVLGNNGYKSFVIRGE